MAKQESKVEHKSCELEFKALGETGSLTGYLSTFGNIDQGGEVVAAGAFKKTLQETAVRPLIWHHDPGEPAKVVGSFTAREDAKGLFIDADFLPDPDSQNMRMKVKALQDRGVKIGLSIGYRVIKEAFEKVSGEVVRVLKELRLNEGSLTLFPMNELALVSGVKSDDAPQVELPPIQYCKNCAQALLEEPGQPTPVEKPLEIEGKPEQRLHLLDQLKFKV